MKRLTQSQRKLIEQHLWLACEMARKVRTKLSYDERFSAAHWGLVRAVTKWKKTGLFERHAQKWIYGAIIRDTMQVNYSRIGGKRSGVSSRVHVEDWLWFGDYDPGFDLIDDADEMSEWRKELANRMHRLTQTQTQAIEMRKAGLVGDRVLRQHGVPGNTNSDRLRGAIQRLRA